MILTENNKCNAFLDYRLYPMMEKAFYGIEESVDGIYGRPLNDSKKIKAPIADMINFLNYNKDAAIKKEFIITFETNGGSYMSSKKVKAGNKLEKPLDPVKPGYEFAGWNKDNYFSQKFDFNTSINNSMKLYAKWNKVSIYDNNLKFKLGNRTYYYDELRFDITITKETGAVVTGVKDVFVQISVGGKVRAKAYFSRLNIKTLGINESITTDIIFSLDTLDFDFWNNNRGTVEMDTEIMFTAEH